jgi:hypothetical protein
MSNSAKDMSKILGILAGCLFVFAILNVLVIKPAVKGAVNNSLTPIVVKLEKIDENLEILSTTVAGHISEDKLRLNKDINKSASKNDVITAVVNEEPKNTE